MPGRRWESDLIYDDDDVDTHGKVADDGGMPYMTHGWGCY